MNTRSCIIAAAALLAGSFGASAQPVLQFTGFEAISPANPSDPQGWGPFNGARRREVGDGLLPALTAAHGGIAAIELTPQPVGPSDFIGYSSDALTDPDDALSPRNNPGYIFAPPEGEKIRIGAWFMIPASDPVVGHTAGLKLEFRRTANNSVYEGFDFLFIDPNNPGNVPGLIAVSTPTGAGVHTNGQWVELTSTFYQARFRIPLWPLPPVNPDARASLLAIRVGVPFVSGARGTIFFDDMSFTRIANCAADFNNSGNVSVQDIFDFLAAYFAGCP